MLPSPHPYFLYPRSDLNIDVDDDDDFINRRPNNPAAAAAVARDFGQAVAIKPDNLNYLFPKAEQVFNEPEPVKNEIPIPNYEGIIKEINKGEIPIELDFFVGAENIDLKNEVMQLGVEDDGLEFLSYLQNDHCADITGVIKIKIHIESGYILFDNVNLNESIYDFFYAQPDKTKKLILIEFQISDTYKKLHEQNWKTTINSTSY